MNEKDKSFKSALKVLPGIAQPSAINPDVLKHYKGGGKAAHWQADDFVKGILAGNKTILSKAITLIESSLAGHQEIAQEVISKCLPYSGNSIRVGISGVPGVGKSTFIEALGKYLTNKGQRLAVLAIDPSSQKSKGSILGDKTRMTELSADHNAYIRPSPSAGSLGGVARKTREAIILCEAAGFHVIFIETVGVGQSETTVAGMVDFFLLLMLPGAGDELQGIKRGIIEMADAVYVNKCDGDRIESARLAEKELRNAIQLFPKGESGWEVVTGCCSSLSGFGIEQVWKTVTDYQTFTNSGGYFSQKRQKQLQNTMYEWIFDALKNNFLQSASIKATVRLFENKIKRNKISPYIAAQELLKIYFR